MEEPSHQSHVNLPRSNEIDGFVEKNVDLDESHVDRFARVYAADLRLIAIIFVVFFLCLILPVSSFVQKYMFASQMIPFSDPIIRASLASLLAYICVLIVGTRSKES